MQLLKKALLVRLYNMYLFIIKYFHMNGWWLLFTDADTIEAV